MWATVVQLVVLDAGRATVLLVLVVLVVLVPLVVLGAGRAGRGAAVERIVVVVGDAAAGNATVRDGDVAAAASPLRASGPALQPTTNDAEMAANASGATRRGRVTSRV